MTLCMCHADFGHIWIPVAVHWISQNKKMVKFRILYSLLIGVALLPSDFNFKQIRTVVRLPSGI